jgi:hypothetical protein
MRSPLLIAPLLLLAAAEASPLLAQAAPPGPAQVADTVVTAIQPPTSPLPGEAESADVTRFSFLVYGDTRGRYDGLRIQHEHSLVVESMLARIGQMAAGPDPVRFVLQSGDAVVNGRYAQQWNVSFVPLIDRLTTEGGVPYFLAPGNHDLPAMARDEGLRNYLSAVAHLIPPDGSPRRLTGYPTYAFGYGNTFVLALDSNVPDDSVQIAWAEAQLAGLDRARYTHVVAFFHHPAFSSGPHGGARVEPQTAVIRARWMPLFRRYHVAMLFAGHDHLFDHWVERYQDADGTSHRIDQVVTGGGGAPLYPYWGEPDLSAYESAGAAEGVQVSHLARPGMEPGENPFHYVVVHVDGADVWMEVVGVDWGRGFQPYRSARTTLGDTGR